MKPFFLILFVSIIQLKFNLALHSTKTAYLDSFNKEQLEYINNPDNYIIKDCTPEQIYLFLRHGARYPNEKQVIKSKEFLKEIKEYRNKTKQQANDIDDLDEDNLNSKTLIDELNVTFTDKPHYALSDLGKHEMHQIAQRFSKRYPSLFNKNNLINHLKEARPILNTQSSSKERSIDSAKSFLHGLFSSNPDQSLEPDESSALKHFIDNIKINDKMLRLFSECLRYLVQIENNYTATTELYKFKLGTEMTQLVDNFKKRHNLNDMKVDPSILIKLFTLCNIEHAHRMPDNWCKLFNQEDYDVIAYYNDLKAYLKKSYGNEINAYMAYLIIKDVFEEMDKHIRDDRNKHRVLLRFGHAENMFPLVTTLGLFYDSNGLKSNNFRENLNRKFKSGILTPFSANLAFILHKCPSNSYKVKLLINELPIDMISHAGKLECTKNSQIRSTCNIMDLKHQLSKYLNVDHDNVCELSNLKSVRSSKVVKEKNPSPSNIKNEL